MDDLILDEQTMKKDHTADTVKGNVTMFNTLTERWKSATRIQKISLITLGLVIVGAIIFAMAGFGKTET